MEKVGTGKMIVRTRRFQQETVLALTLAAADGICAKVLTHKNVMEPFLFC